MKVDGVAYRTIWVEPDGWSVGVIDQTRLPHDLVTARLTTADEAARAIRTMLVRGAPLIGATGAYGIALAMQAEATDANLRQAYALLVETRPTAVNLRWALDRMAARLRPLAPSARADAAYAEAAAIADEDVAICRAIGDHGATLIRAAAERHDGRPVNVLTHCNAGWLATVDWGTALAPIYVAFEEGIPLHVWVDETRPRNQGASLTAWELGRHGVPHTIIADNAGGHYMRLGQVDLCLVGTDRTTATGDVCNKIGTYLKALAAHDNGVPFHVALPSPTIDWTIEDGLKEIPIEERDGRELSELTGRTRDGRIETVRVTPEGSPIGNPAFDVTPARLVTGLVTERGLCPATREGLLGLFPEHRA
jgi:methylthioribose-1-phosphate isomerase